MGTNRRQPRPYCAMDLPCFLRSTSIDREVSPALVEAVSCLVDACVFGSWRARLEEVERPTRSIRSMSFPDFLRLRSMSLGKISMDDPGDLLVGSKPIRRRSSPARRLGVPEVRRGPQSPIDPSGHVEIGWRRSFSFSLPHRSTGSVGWGGKGRGRGHTWGFLSPRRGGGACTEERDPSPSPPNPSGSSRRGRVDRPSHQSPDEPGEPPPQGPLAQDRTTTAYATPTPRWTMWRTGTNVVVDDVEGTEDESDAFRAMHVTPIVRRRVVATVEETSPCDVEEVRRPSSQNRLGERRMDRTDSNPPRLPHATFLTRRRCWPFHRSATTQSRKRSAPAREDVPVRGHPSRCDHVHGTRCTLGRVRVVVGFGALFRWCLGTTGTLDGTSQVGVDPSRWHVVSGYRPTTRRTWVSHVLVSSGFPSKQ